LRLAIPPARNPKYREWTKAEIRLLGTMPDGDVARRIGRPYHVVLGKRIAMRIANRNPRYVWWSPKELDLLARFPVEEVARRTNRSVKAVRLKLWKLQRPRGLV
jgi:ribosomal protein L24E